MHTHLRTLAATALIAAALTSTARAGGITASVEGPMKDGKYFVHAAACHGIALDHVTAFAEGVVKGERRTLPLALKPTADGGVYSFERAWPAQGRWLVRVDLGGKNYPVVVADLAGNGRVERSQLVWDRDGRQACEQKLAAFTR